MGAVVEDLASGGSGVGFWVVNAWLGYCRRAEGWECWNGGADICWDMDGSYRVDTRHGLEIANEKLVGCIGSKCIYT